MQIEMTTTQFKKNVFAIRDKYNFMLEKHNRLISYLKSIKPEMDKKVEEYNDNLRKELANKYSSITKEGIIKECFTKEVKTEYVESGWLWWHKIEKVEEEFYTITKRNYDDILELHEKDFSDRLYTNNAHVLYQLTLPDYNTWLKEWEERKYIAYIDISNMKALKLNLNIAAPELDVTVKNWLEQITFLEENSIRKVELSGEEVELLSKGGTGLIEKPKQKYVCYHLGRWGWKSFDLSSVIDTLSKVYNKPKEQIKQELDNL